MLTLNHKFILVNSMCINDFCPLIRSLLVIFFFADFFGEKTKMSYSRKKFLIKS